MTTTTQSARYVHQPQSHSRHHPYAAPVRKWHSESNGGECLPPSPPRSRRDQSETPPLRLGVAFGGNGSGKWWDEELPPPPASLTSILTSFRQSGEGDRELLLSILSAKKAEEERLTSLIQTRLTILQARLSLHSAVAAAVPPTLAEMERTPSLTSSISGEGNSPTGVMTVTPMPIPFGYVPPVQAGGQASESISNGRENEKDERGDRTLPLPDPNPSYRSRAQAQSHSRSRSGSRSPNALHQPRLPFIQNLVSATNNDESKAHSLYSHHSGQSRKRYDPCEFALPLEGLGRSRSSRSRSPRDGNASESGRVRERGGLEMLLDVGMGIEREGRESDERE